MKTNAANLYTDFSSFSQLRAQARDNSAAGRQAAAQQIESLFLGMMLKSMRAAGGSMLGGPGAQVREEMFDSQMALSMSKHSKLGFAKLMLREFNLRQGAAASMPPPQQSAAAGQVPVGRFANALWGRAVAQVAAIKPNPSPENFQHRVPGLKAIEAPAKIVAAQTFASDAFDDATAPVTWRTADEFVTNLWPAAQRAAKALGTRAEAVMAVAALETGWGKHMPASADGISSNNLFGIKAHGWAGPVSHAPTLEFEAGRFVRKLEPFRRYDSAQQSFADFVNFIKSRPRYAAVLDSGDDPLAFVRALQQAGYATDPQYADKLENLLRSETMRKAQTLTTFEPQVAVTTG